MSLADEPCVACRPGAQPVSAQDLVDFQSQHPKWNLITKNGVQQLECRFQFKDYLQALAFTNQIAQMAQAEDHHPSIVLEWGQVTVTWWTHTIRGLHRNDLIMAARTDRAYA